MKRPIGIKWEWGGVSWWYRRIVHGHHEFARTRVGWWLSLNLLHWHIPVGFMWNPSGNHNPPGRWDVRVGILCLHLVIVSGERE